MLPATTQAAAREQLLRYYTETLRILPPELALTLRHPDLPNAVLHRGVTLPWNDSDPDNVLEFFTISYWVLGTTPDTCDRYFDLVIRAWEQQGWPTQTDENPRSADTRTPDGYGFTLIQSVNGYLSLSGATPSFEPDAEEATPYPTRIDHP
ncbi:hypothetical protein [Nocardia transvalensis]|uniref:hypothetical protein n=1 Tax=Nocardia transvalensis TaxID=37333 RepID=UPI001895FDF0|nr:hypothetical protein [Nocardia transvalensis]MBF6327534.1 hypothetical protein [Nocardia transvalensis]